MHKLSQLQGRFLLCVTSVCCVSGESVTVTVCGTEDETAALLATVLDGDRTAASLLAGAIHQDPDTINAHTDGLAVPLDPSQLGIWIDPIGEKAGLSPHVAFPKNKTILTAFHGLVLLHQMLPASTSRGERRCWRRATSPPQGSTAPWSSSGCICAARVNL